MISYNNPLVNQSNPICHWDQNSATLCRISSEGNFSRFTPSLISQQSLVGENSDEGISPDKKAGEIFMKTQFKIAEEFKNDRIVHEVTVWDMLSDLFEKIELTPQIEKSMRMCVDLYEKGLIEIVVFVSLLGAALYSCYLEIQDLCVKTLILCINAINLYLRVRDWCLQYFQGAPA